MSKMKLSCLSKGFFLLKRKNIDNTDKSLKEETVTERIWLSIEKKISRNKVGDLK